MVFFNEMGLNESILKAVKELGFNEPTPVQEKGIPKILERKADLIAQAQTGTGKTAAFGLPIIQMVDVAKMDTQALVLCPTRELCMQISGDLKKFSKYIDGFRVVPVYGGTSIDAQVRSLKKGGQIVVGTPGRVKDLINRKVLKIESIDWLVLDEADEMLNMGFKEDLDDILKGTPKGKQTLLFSATMPREILRIASTYMNKPDEIAMGKKNVGAENVIHEYYVTLAKHRYEVLKRIADMNPDIYGIVFCRTRQETKDVAEKFMNDGYNADALHGDLSQPQRDYVMNRFRSRSLQMLVATDVAARGLDVNNLSHVINYNLPDDLEVYIHRSGRTGRAGRSGISITIVHTRETNRIKGLEKISGKKFERKQIPGGKEICKKQLFNLVDKVENVELNEEQIGEFLPEINKKLEWLDREDLIKHFVSVEFNRFLAYYKNAPDLNADVNTTTERRGSRKGSTKEFTRFYINIGKKNKLNAARLIGLINESTKIRDIEIGRIDIMKGFSFIEVDKAHEADVMKSFDRRIEFEGTRVAVQVSKGEAPKARDSEPRYNGKRSGKKPDGKFNKGKGAFNKGKGAFSKGERSFEKGGQKGQGGKRKKRPRL